MNKIAGAIMWLGGAVILNIAASTVNARQDIWIGIALVFFLIGSNFFFVRDKA